MRFMKTALIALLLLALPCLAAAQGIEISALTPIEFAAEENAQVLALYCGPTQGFYSHGEQTLDTGAPYVVFGQYDCWAMAAQGTKDAFGPIGWVEAGSITDIPYEPQLCFEDGFAAMIEEAAQMTDNPLAENPFEGWDMALEAGTQVTVLAQLGEFIYVQAEIEDAPARVFVPSSSVF